MSISNHASNGIAFTDVPPPMRPTLNVVFGFSGTSNCEIVATARPSACIGFDNAERAVAVPARPLERDAIAQAADRDVRDAEAGAVDRDEAIDLPLHAFVEEILHAAQIAEAFFADRADKRDRARRLDLRLVHRAHDREQHGETAAVVADAGTAQDVAFALDLDVGAFGKHGVEVRGEHEARPRLRAGPIAEHVAFLVDAHVLQAELAEHLRVDLGALRFLERRRLDLAQPNLILDGLRLRWP